MNLKNFLPSDNQIKEFKDIESILFTRKKNSKIAGNFAILFSVIQAFVLLWPLVSGIELNKIGIFFHNPSTYIPAIFLTFFLLIYFLLHRTGVLLKESQEPFRYSFYVEPFKEIENTKGDNFNLKNDFRMNLLHHDLTEIINQRIKRFSILNEFTDEQDEKQIIDRRRSSHIQIYGNFAIREDKENNEWIIHVMPYVRIGTKGSPATLAQSVRFPLTTDETPDEFDTHEYNQLLERVYSRITTEIYAQIEKDVQNKISLLPTPYLQANAYYHEAKDMANSNTINAFDSAIKLYEEALRKIDLTLMKRISVFFIGVPFIRIFFIRYIHQYARIQIGFARCLIYKKRIAALSGRKTNPVFDIRQNLIEVIRNLELLHYSIGKNRGISSFKGDLKTFSILAFLSFPSDSWLRRMMLIPSSVVFNKTRQILFNAYVAQSLTDSLLNAYLSAKRYLDNAKAVAPDLTNSDVLFILAEAYIEPNIERALFLFRQATEKAPSFQIAQYDLAYWSEMKFRMSGEINPNRVKLVINEYDKVLRINPGNIAALAAQGYLYWLINKNEIARRKFEEGCEVKSIVSETFIGILVYGLARILAEKGTMDESYDLFNQATAANPNIGTFSIGDGLWSSSSFFDYITPKLLNRFQEYHDKVESFADNYLKENISSNKIISIVHSYVLNDLANAYLNFYKRHGDQNSLLKAIENYDKSLTENPSNTIAKYNKSLAITWRNYQDGSNESEKFNDSVKLLDEVIKDNPKWIEALAYYLEITHAHFLSDINKEIIKKENEIIKKETQNKYSDKQITRIEKKDDLVTNDAFQNKRKELPTTGLINNELDELKELKEKKEKLLDKIRKIIETTKLISLYDGFRLEHLNNENIIKFLNTKLNWTRLDEEDVRSLRIYTSGYYYNISKSENKDLYFNELLTAKRLFNHFTTYYYHEDFDIWRLKRDLGNKIKKELSDRHEFSDNPQVLYSEKFFSSVFKRKSVNEMLQNIIPDELKQLFRVNNINFGDNEFDLKKDEIPNRWLIYLTCNNGFNSELREFSLVKKRRKITVYPSDQNISNEIIESTIKYWIEQDPFDISYYRLAQQYLSQDLYAEYLKKALDQEKTIELLIIYAETLYNSGKIAEFQILFDKQFYNLTNEQKARFYDRIGNLYANDHKLHEAIPYFEKSGDLLKEPEKKALLYNRIGNFYYGENNKKEARTYYIKAQNLDIKKPVYLSNIALTFAYDDQPDWNQAILYFEKAIHLREEVNEDLYGFEYYFDYLTEAYYKAGKISEFIDQIEKTDKSNKSINDKVKGVIYNRYGNLLYFDFNEQEAMIFYNKAIKCDPVKPIYYSNLGLMYSSINPPDWKKAFEWYQKAVDIRKNVKDDTYGLDYFYNNLAESAYKSGMYEEFFKQFEESEDLSDNPEKKAIIYNRIGNLLYNDFREIEAITCYEKAIELDSGYPVYHSNLGLMNVSINPPKLEKALNHYLKALDLCKKNPGSFNLEDYYFNIAEVYFKIGNVKDFNDYIETSLDIASNALKKAGIYNRIGNMYFVDNKFDQAISFYQKAISNDNTKPIYFSNLGRAYSNLKDKDSAILNLQKAVELRKNIVTDDYDLQYYQNYLEEVEK